ncbi:MAG: hypothetical protein RL722_2933 [Pseudomonadota bacterium]|jgi:phosphonate transport system substrate-binding protein
MSFQLSVSPDFSPDHIAGWYVFNTWLQRRLGIRMHVELHDSFPQHHAALAAGQIDLVFASPSSAKALVREQGYTALAAPINRPDEAVIAVLDSATSRRIEDLQPGCRLAQTSDPDVGLIARMMLEPADLHAGNVQVVPAGSYVLVAKQLITGKADAGIFLARAFDELGAAVKRQLRPLARSEIGVLRHMLLAGPRLAEHHAALRDLICAMHLPGSDGARALEALGLPGFEDQDAESVEFMIDMVQTLMA